METQPPWKQMSWSAGARQLDDIRRAKSRGIAAANVPLPPHILTEREELTWSKVGASRAAGDLAVAWERIRTMPRSELDELAVLPDAVHDAS
ncbi:MAG: hypothetical protein HY056_07700 [Proteobacteria bacterium]|nr:hypothetical protein [Pseudomonadota bacterium]